MWFLIVEKIIYRWKLYSYDSPMLKRWINIIEWPNWSWKSTLSDLIYFWLGWKIKQFISTGTKRHKEICEDINNSVELHINVNNIP